MENQERVTQQLTTEIASANHTMIDCPDCKQHYFGESLIIATFLYGVILLTGKSICYLGITCPSCLKTILKQDDFQSIKETFLYLSTSITTNTCVINQRLQYFPSTRTPSGKIAEVEMFNIVKSPISGEFGYDEIERNSLIDYLDRNTQLKDEYLMSYSVDIPVIVANNCIAWWYKPEEIELLLKVENSEKVKIFPRYYYQNSIFDKVNQYCWDNFLYERNLIDSIEVYSERRENFKKQLRLAGVDLTNFNELCRINIGDPPDDDQYILNQFRERKSIDFSPPSTFFEILISDPNPWEIPFAPYDEYKGFWKTKYPFLKKGIPKLFADINLNLFRINAMQDSHDRMLSEIMLNFDKGYIQKHLLENQEAFIKDYIDLSLTPYFSYADLWELKEKYLRLLYQNFKENAVKENNYVFCSEGKAWRLTFDSKPTSGYTGGGFKYLHFLICNKNEPFSYYQLDNLDGILIKDDTSDSFLPDEEAKVLMVATTGSGPSNKNNEETRRRKLSRGRLDHRSMITPERKEFLENYRDQLEDEIKDLREGGSAQGLRKADEMENQVKKINEYLMSAITKYGAIKKFKSDGEYKQIKDKINISIRRALDIIRKYDEKAWQHFENSLNRQHGEICYRPDSDINWFIG